MVFRKQNQPGRLAVNYFEHQSGNGGGVPNNTTLVLWSLAKLAKITNDISFLELSTDLVTWLSDVQCDNGELPYCVGATSYRDQPHFLCYQYNAFEFMDLLHYYQLTNDAAVKPILAHLAQYLSTGLTEAGIARYDCQSATPEVAYYTSAIAQALSQATLFGLGDYQALADQAFNQVLAQQQQDGGFKFYSQTNYGFLADRRSYPRYLAMILNHLLKEYQTRSLDVTISNEEISPFAPSSTASGVQTDVHTPKIQT